jgi:formylglycine-generating enzyme required for sulfatase activity
VKWGTSGLLALSILLGVGARADDWLFHPPPAGRAMDQQLPGPPCLTPNFSFQEGRSKPCAAPDYEVWLADMKRARDERRIRIGYDSSRYDLPALKWTQSSFIQPQMMVQDRYFYDPVAARYTVERYLDDLQGRYGGIDAVLIWPTYPNLGVDDRNQLDMVRAMPGGVDGVRQMIAAFHRRGVRVLFPMMMWDQGTHNPGTPWPEAIATLMTEIGADGVNGDTQSGVPRAFSEAAEKTGHPLAFESELSPSDEAVAYNVMTWGQYQYPFVPSVDRFKWIEPRHMVNISDRWKRDKTDDLQFAFFNGIGLESWENVWGIWNGITPRDGETIRRLATLERALAPFLSSQDWQPFWPMLRYGVFASRWPLRNAAVWTIVNRDEYDSSGPQMEVAAEPGRRYFDLYHGAELKPERQGDRWVLSFDLEAKGFGVILASQEPLNDTLSRLMAEMKPMTAKPLSSFSREWVSLPQHVVAIAATAKSATPPPEMVNIPAGDFLFRVNGIEIEGIDAVGVDVQYPWEDSPRAYHQHFMRVSRFWMDKYPVTNAQFRRFLEATHYRPKDDINFLRDWRNGIYPQGWDNRPVTWVSREDAEAYATWAGKRLPHEWEWQYAAQGTDGRSYPWGNDWDAAAVPIADTSRSMRGPDDVTAHPKGASVFGVADMVGNVWQWTDELVDEHTRAAILRGGSYYKPQGSLWYFPQAYKLTEHGKLLLMAPSMDRSGAIGFRCVKDVN